MPTYYEIYDRFSKEYDELVNHEDYQNNLQKTLLSLFDWKNKDVIEAGIGTGRVTAKYISLVRSVCGLDREINMLNQAKSNLLPYAGKIKFEKCDNLNLNSIKETYDIFIEGWAFGHTICDHPGNTAEVAEQLISQASELLDESGQICFIETLGTNCTSPKPPNEMLAAFYVLLENGYGFKKKEIDTSYMFRDNKEAQRIMGFFFGQEMRKSVKSLSKNIIPEWTGIWYRDK